MSQHTEYTLDKTRRIRQKHKTGINQVQYYTLYWRYGQCYQYPESGIITGVKDRWQMISGSVGLDTLPDITQIRD